MSDLEHDLGLEPEDLEKKASYQFLANKYTKPQLVEKTIVTFERLSEILDLVAIALPDTTIMSPTERTVYDSARAHKIRRDASSKLQSMVRFYQESKEAAEKEIDNGAS